MKEALEKLWSEYFAEECAVISTSEERELVKGTVEMRKALNELLTDEESEAVEKYAEALYDIQGFFVKKAFFSGCEFAIAFLLGLGNFGKR